MMLTFIPHLFIISLLPSKSHIYFTLISKSLNQSTSLSTTSSLYYHKRAHVTCKERALCAPLLVSPVISRLAPRQMTRETLSAKGGIMSEKWPFKFSL
jgi:hypothetical protein